VEKSVPIEVAQDAFANRGRQRGDVGVARRVGAVEAQFAIGRFGEHAVEHDRVGVQVQIGGRAEALHEGDRAAAAGQHPALACATPVETEHGANEDLEHRCATSVIVGEVVAQPVGKAQNELPHGHERHDTLRQVPRRYPSCACRRSSGKSRTLAAERHEALELAIGAAEAREAVREHAAL
jgi:hypothetical protein